MRRWSSPLCIVIERQRALLLTTTVRSRGVGGSPLAWQCVSEHLIEARPIRFCFQGLWIPDEQKVRTLAHGTYKGRHTSGSSLQNVSSRASCTGASGASLAHIPLPSLILHFSISESACPTNEFLFYLCLQSRIITNTEMSPLHWIQFFKLIFYWGIVDF